MVANFQIRCVSYNVGGLPDTERLMQKQKGVIREGAIAEVRSKLENHVKLSSDDQYFLNSHYTSLAKRNFAQILAEDPDVICLQEMNFTSKGELRTKEHEYIIDQLKKNYIVVGSGCTAIAYNKENFSLLSKDSLETGTTVIELKDKRYGKVIRVFSDQVAGFNKTSKNAKAAAQQGDKDLKNTVSAYAPKKSLLARIRDFLFGKNKEEPDLYIYALDANTVASYVKKDKSHPERLRALENNLFLSDQKDMQPTIVDHNDHTPHKYDYIYCKGSEGVDVEVASGLVQIDGESLNQPAYALSDHLPVMANIYVTESNSLLWKLRNAVANIFR